MSLYYEAAEVLKNADNLGGSLKSRTYNRKDAKNSQAQIYALVSESTKWSPVLKEVIEKSGLLGEEKKLNAVLALVLVHDLLLTRKGIAAPQNHPLCLAVTRHKTRLNAELTKSRLRLGFPSLDALRQSVSSGDLPGQLSANQPDNGDSEQKFPHPRWIRINELKTEIQDQLNSTFKGYQQKQTLAEVLTPDASSKVYYLDENIPNLIALPPKHDLSKEDAYLSGKLIFQDKASCFPAYLLNINSEDGDIIDACAAPGNKTTHLAAISSSKASFIRNRTIFAFERDKKRAETLRKMVTTAGAEDLVSVLGSVDFLTARPTDDEGDRFGNVSAILLDPSCSGSGMVGRDDEAQLFLPVASGGEMAAAAVAAKPAGSRKRKRGSHVSQVTAPSSVDEKDVQAESATDSKYVERLQALSAFQLKMVEHAMKFPSVKRIVYSTCSVHHQENEGVVMRALATHTAIAKGWRILKRYEQSDGLQKWHVRGDLTACQLIRRELESSHANRKDVDEIANSCIRCHRGTADGTMGFFVAGFVRRSNDDDDDDDDDEWEWNGFSD